MRKFFIPLLSVSLLLMMGLSSCQEWEPVFTLKYEDPAAYSQVAKTPTITIAELKEMYIENGSKPLEILGNYVIGGQVITSDESGNLYKEIYIQDETGAIDLKIGKNSLYSDYKLGQWLYVDCNGLTIGSYSGMPQLGIEDETGEYETAYIEAQYIIDEHIFRGSIAPLPDILEVTEEDINDAIAKGGFRSNLWGKLVTIKGLKYGAPSSYRTDAFKRIFALIYIDPNKDKKAQSNRIFLSDKTYGVNTWAMTKTKFLEYLGAGNFDSATTGDDRPLDADIMASLKFNAAAVTLSHYFSLGVTPVQIRTSGYAKFADTPIDPVILGDPDSESADGASIDVTGILSIYSGAAQFTLIDLNGVVINKK